MFEKCALSSMARGYQVDGLDLNWLSAQFPVWKLSTVIT